MVNIYCFGYWFWNIGCLVDFWVFICICIGMNGNGYGYCLFICIGFCDFFGSCYINGCFSLKWIINL